MKSNSPKIWTRLTVSIFSDDNYYTTDTFLKLKENSIEQIWFALKN